MTILRILLSGRLLNDVGGSEYIFMRLAFGLNNSGF